MPSITMLPATDPVSQAIGRSALMADRHPIPLSSIAYDIHIRGGLADVVATRTFRNDEAHSIEATLTFPLPVHAVLYNLEACIGDRVVKAVARAKSAARQTYEEAIEHGKTTVIHEELFKGVHLLSVGHIASATEIKITARFALTLAHLGGRFLLRIPTTIGDIYGSSGLPDSDDLIHGGSAIMGWLTVATDVGEPVLLGGALTEGRAHISLDAPIHIEVKGWRAQELKGRAADGRTVTLRVQPTPVGKANIAAHVVIDHSGSMSGLCSDGLGLSKHAAALLGLSEAADDLCDADDLHLWEFDDMVRDLGRAKAGDWRAHIRHLSGPSGGTEIGCALDAVLAAASARDVILVTDGKSHALDVQRLAHGGARFTVVLIGEDSLEANVGYLSVLTGGEIFVPDGADVAEAVRSALRSVCRPARDPRDGLQLAGMQVGASWAPTPIGPVVDDNFDRAVAAYAASLLLTSVEEKEAARIAEAEGLVTHLTSLVLVDEDGATQTGLPTTRKIALPTPRTAAAPLVGSPRLWAAASRACAKQSFSHGRPRTVGIENRRELCAEAIA